MAVAAPLFAFEHTFARDLPGLVVPWQAAPVPEPRLLALNEPLAAELGVDPQALRAPEGVDVLIGRAVQPGSQPVAMAYAGHQFGGYSPRLGDGRALLVGEVVDCEGRRRDIHLKGSGRTPFARGGDGKAAVGPMLREYVIGEAMHALGIPTTRALAVVATGEEVAREAMLPGAILVRVAASHIRVGTFEYAARLGDPDLVRALADHAIARHHPGARGDYPAFFQAVVDSQAELIARWMLVAFVHGVMNTDNMAISGETIDYGPCAFMEAFDPATVFSSIDHGGRYAYGNQPLVAQWNLARLAETLLPLIDADSDRAVAAATEALQSFGERHDRAFLAGMRAKLGLDDEREDDAGLVRDMLTELREQRRDFTSFFRALSAHLRGGETVPSMGWAERYWARLGDRDPAAVADAMDRVNPLYLPRNQLVEEALAAATEGDLAPFERLLEAVTKPFDERPGLERYAQPAEAGFGAYRTFCGT